MCRAFSYHTTSLASLTAKPIGPYQCIYQALKIVYWGHQPPWSLCQLFPSVNRSDPGMSSIANQRSYVALGQLHGP